MSIGFGDFRSTAQSGRRGAEVHAARASTGREARFVVLGPLPSSLEAEGVLARALRYAAGVPEVGAALGLCWLPPTAAFPSALGSEARSLLVAFESPARSLEDELRSGRPLPFERTAGLLLALAAGLGALHDQGVAHGLLRADLIAATENSAGVLGGFGVAQLAASLGGAVRARDALPPEYRAPELCGPVPVRAEAAADIFALGVLAAEMLAGQCASEAGPTPRKLGATVSDRVEQLVAQALASSMDARPRDVRRWAQELAAAIRADAAARAPEPLPSSPPLPANAREAPVVGSVAPQKPEPSPAPIPSGPAEASRPSSLPPSSTDARSSGASIAVLVSLVLGALFMCGGVGALFGYQLMNTRRTVTAVASALTHPVAPPSSAAPPPPVAPELDSSTPEPDLEEEPEPKPPVRSAKPAPAPKNPEPRSPVIAVAAEDAAASVPLDATVPILGSRDALVTLVVFGDLECPHTRKSLGTLFKLKAALKGDLRIAWRNRPLPEHSLARPAALSAAALHADFGNDVFWNWIEQASVSSAPPSEAELGRWLERSGAPAGSKPSPAAERLAEERLTRDLELAGRFNVRATPTFFINGIRVEGNKPYGELRRLVDHELKTALGALAMGVRRSDLYTARTNKNFINVGRDVIERTCPKVAGSPARGAADALVTLVEFSDFECEYCKRAEPTLLALLGRYPKQLRVIWKNFPLDQHPNAGAAAALAMEIFGVRGDRGFWQAHEALFKLSPDFDEPSFLAIAKSAALAPEVARDALHRAERAAAVAKDVALGEKLGVSGTPTFFIDGRRISGARPLPEFIHMIDEELALTRALVAAGTPSDKVYAVLCGIP